MKFFAFFLIISCSASSCRLSNGGHEKTKNLEIENSSSLVMDSVPIHDSINQVTGRDTPIYSIEDGDNSYEKEFARFNEIRESYFLSYQDTIVLDTVFTIQNDIIHLIGMYYCDNNSMLLIPSSYYVDKRDFRTHNFISKIRISSNKIPLVDTIVTKNDFKEVITDEFRKYGVLLSPYFRNYNIQDSSISLGYSISVPLTDIGMGVNLKIGLFGGGLTPEER